MSAIHTGHIEIRTVNGRPQFTGTSADHAVTGWSKPAEQPQALTPKQRAGNGYDVVVLASKGGTR